MKRQLELSLIIPDGVTNEQIQTALETGIKDILFWNDKVKKFMKLQAEHVVTKGDLVIDISIIGLIDADEVNKGE